MAPKTITVTSTLPVAADGGSPVAFYEQSDEHPNGQAWVAGPNTVEVAKTDGVKAALDDGRIEEVSTTDAKRAAADRAKVDREAAERKAAEEAEAKRLADEAAKNQGNGTTA